MHSNKNSEYLWPDYFAGVVCSYAQNILAVILVTVREKSPEKPQWVLRVCESLTAGKTSSLFALQLVLVEILHLWSSSLVKKQLMAGWACVKLLPSAVFGAGSLCWLTTNNHQYDASRVCKRGNPVPRAMECWWPMCERFSYVLEVDLGLFLAFILPLNWVSTVHVQWGLLHSKCRETCFSLFWIWCTDCAVCPWEGHLLLMMTV